VSSITLTTASGVATFGDWLDGLDRVGRRLYEADGELWSEFAEFHRRFLLRVEHLEYEGQLSRSTAATTALAVQESEFTGARTAMEEVLSRAQARLGARTLRAQFKRDPGKSRRGKAV
jgi:hypothetical protein